MRLLMSSIIAASEVDLPEPVLPVTRISPLLARHSWRTACGHVELIERQRLRRDGAEHRAHAVELAHDVDAKAALALERVGEIGAILAARSARRPCAA